MVTIGPRPRPRVPIRRHRRRPVRCVTRLRRGRPQHRTVKGPRDHTRTAVMAGDRARRRIPRIDHRRPGEILALAPTAITVSHPGPGAHRADRPRSGSRRHPTPHRPEQRDEQREHQGHDAGMISRHPARPSPATRDRPEPGPTVRQRRGVLAGADNPRDKDSAVTRTVTSDDGPRTWRVRVHRLGFSSTQGAPPGRWVRKGRPLAAHDIARRTPERRGPSTPLGHDCRSFGPGTTRVPTGMNAVDMTTPQRRG